MIFPPEFTFNQGNIQDFIDCRRRFLLKYVYKLNWPAGAVEPYHEYEDYAKQGQFFHQLAHKYFLGIPEELLTSTIKEEELKKYWGLFLQFSKHILLTDNKLNNQLFPELLLSSYIEGVRVNAKYDLVFVNQSGDVTIYDWKTSRKRPRAEHIRSRMQTRLYPYLLCERGLKNLDGHKFDPEKVQLIYWYTSFPQNPETIRYNDNQYTIDREYISNIVGRITQLSVEDFVRTSNNKTCRFCHYRTLCDRGYIPSKESRFDDGWDYDEDVVLNNLDNNGIYFS